MFSKGGNTKIFYGWIVLILCYIGLISSLGIRLSFGAFITPWEQEFNVGRSALTLVSALSLAVYGIFQPVAGRLSDIYGARTVLPVSLVFIAAGLLFSQWFNNIWTLAVFYGILASAGFSGASNITASAAIIQWFNKHQGLALGLVTSGMAAGQMIIVPLSIYMVGHYQWKSTMFIYGLVVLFVIAPLLFIFIRSRPEDMGLKPYGAGPGYTPPAKIAARPQAAGPGLKEKLSLLFKNPLLWILVISYFFCGFTCLGLVGTHLIPYAEGKSISSAIISLTVGCAAAFNITGTILSGYISDHVSRARLLASLYLIRSISLIILFFAQDTMAFLAFAVLFGISDMAVIAPTSSLCANLLGKQSVGIVFGFISISHQVGAAFGALIPGILYDWTGGYSVAILLAAGALFSVGAMFLLIRDNRMQE